MRMCVLFAFAPIFCQPQTAAAQASGVPEKYKALVAANLRWLAEKQNKDGSWSNVGKQSDVAITSLAGLAFLMEGSTASTGAYSETIQKAIEWLRNRCGNDGFIKGDGGNDNLGAMMHQGYALCFLASALAREDKAAKQGGLEGRLSLARQREMKETLERAIQFAVRAQGPSGGWFITEQTNQGDFVEASLAVILGLQAAQQAGVDVPQEAMKKAADYLAAVTTSRGGVVMTTPAMKGGERPGLTIAALASTYGAKQFGPDLLKKWLAYSQYSIADQNPPKDQFFHAVAIHGLGDEGAVKLLGAGKANVTWSKDRDRFLSHFATPGGTVHSTWHSSPVFGAAVNLIALQLDTEHVPVFRMKKDW